MRVWAQSSHRSMWPPSAAVRQASMGRHDAQLAKAHMTSIRHSLSGDLWKCLLKFLTART